MDHILLKANKLRSGPEEVLAERRDKQKEVNGGSGYGYCLAKVGRRQVFSTGNNRTEQGQESCQSIYGEVLFISQNTANVKSADGLVRFR